MPINHYTILILTIDMFFDNFSTPRAHTAKNIIIAEMCTKLVRAHRSAHIYSIEMNICQLTNEVQN